MNVNDETGVVSFGNIYFYANSVYASDAKPYDFSLRLKDLSLWWGDYQNDYVLFRNNIKSLEDSVRVDPFWGWYDDEGLILDLFRMGNNTITTSIDDGKTQLTFKFVGLDQDDSSRYLFNGINCNKTLILTEASTDGANDPRSQG